MEYKKAHFIGIAGAGMSGVAKLLRESGVEITGSDQEVYPPISTLLEREHIPYQTPYAASNIPADADVIVIGKNAKLVAETNPEVAAAYASGKKILSFPEVLAGLSEGKETIVVAGSYGKSTSTALLAHCLAEARLDPSFFIGAVPLSPVTNAHIGTGNLFVMEGDEYPASNTDPRSKFLLMHPSHLLVTPLAHDHVNIFPTPESYLKPFENLLQLPPEDATVIVCAEGTMSKNFVATIKRPIVTYGVHTGDFTAANIVWGEKTSFDLKHPSAHSGQAAQSIVRVEMSLLGEHNIQNIVGVGAFLFSKHLITPEQFASAVATFKGIVRRLDKKSEKTSVPIFEGFGTSFEKAKSAIAAMRQHFPNRRLLIVFEPHTFSWRNREALHWYDTVFAGATKVLVYEPASQGATTHAQSTQEEIVARVAASGINAVAITNEQQALAILRTELTQDDYVLLLTSGDLGGLIESIPKLAERKFPK